MTEKMQPTGFMCSVCGWTGDPEGDWTGDHCEAHAAAGFVACDQFCPAKEAPQTSEEYRLAYLHWRGHSAFHGCSHGR